MVKLLIDGIPSFNFKNILIKNDGKNIGFFLLQGAVKIKGDSLDE